MQYKTSKKILIDKRKFETLKRLNCPKEILIDLIFDNKLTLTGDSLIDDNLESLIEIKEFKNWGGNRNPKGNNQYTLGQVDQQVDLGQDVGQVVDKDKDRDKDRDNISIKKEKEINKEKEKEILKNFNEFYLAYPNKKAKTKALEAYKKAILAGGKVCALSKPSIIGDNALETSHTAIMDGLKKYIDDIRIKKTEPKFIKHPATWLNQKCWEDEYDSFIDYSDPMYHNSRL